MGHPFFIYDIRYKKTVHTNCMDCLSGDPVGIRTLDLLIRSQSLYPAELPSHKVIFRRPLYFN